jgi:4-hydroxy-3-polyprenylbenzoate decarboxylase
MNDLVVGLTGASGALYGLRLIDAILAAGRRVHVTASPAAAIVFETEVGVILDEREMSIEAFELNRVFGERCLSSRSTQQGELIFHHHRNFMGGIASGSFQTAGMAICPCSMGTLASLAHGLSNNLIHRAADVHLKERRKLILVPRETPLGTIQLDNMRTLSAAGAIILPAMPGFYHQPKSILDLIDFVVARVCDHLGVEHQLGRRWGDD